MKNTYDFSWEDLGDLQMGRPHLGAQMPVVVYRLLEYTFKDVLSQELGLEKTAAIFVKAGHLAGREFCKNLLDCSLALDPFIAALQKTLVTMKMGILRIESADLANLQFTLTLSEDLDCSGLPLYGETVCDYDEGFIAGIFHQYTGLEFQVKEVDCWATGDRTCRFLVEKNTGQVAG